MLFDTHAHLDDAQFEDDREAVIAGMRAGGIDLCMTVGADIESSRRCMELARLHPGYLYAAVGVHPQEAAQVTEENLACLAQWAQQPQVRAWGEIGLDYYYEDNPPRPVQREAFARQLEAAREAQLPVILHIRDAYGDSLDILRARRGKLPRGVVHCYSGSWESAREYIDMGFLISFTGSVTFKNATRIAEVSDHIPLDRLMVETDSPYMTPVPLRGHRNDPRNVYLVAQFLAARRGMETEALARITMENGKKLFNI